MSRPLLLEPLSAEGFAAFGQVIDKSGSEHFTINDGLAIRYHDLATIDTGAQGGKTLVNIVRARAWPRPVEITMMERHRQGSQAFVPLEPCRWAVVVAPPGRFRAPAMRGFLAGPGQGVNYNRGTWHCPLMVLDHGTDFLVIDRGGRAPDCDIISVSARLIGDNLRSGKE